MKMSIPKVSFKFKGRINRKTFGLFFLAFLFLDIVLTEILGDLGEFLFILIGFFPLLTLQIQRWHDLDKSGWWTLANIVPILNLLCLIRLLSKKGTEGINRFGEDPLAT
jgi:uncharacterized membrane protein YhaH (DUF805 family)